MISLRALLFSCTSLLAACGGQVTVVEARAACPDGALPGPDGACGQAAQVSPKPVAQEESTEPPNAGPAPNPQPRARVAALPGTDPAETMRYLRDPRLGKPPRARQVLVTIIQGLEAQVQAASGAPQPGLLKAIGDAYLELEVSAVQGNSHKVANAARLAAIKYYHQLSTRYPKFCPAPGASCGDDLLYALGYTYERADDLDNARKTYLNLIQNYPRSRWIPHTYLAFGELFFHESLGDPSKWPFAEQSFQEVLKYPYPANDVYGYAMLRLALVHQNKGESAKAAAAFRRLALFARQHPDEDSIQLPAQFIPDGI